MWSLYWLNKIDMELVEDTSIFFFCPDGVFRHRNWGIEENLRRYNSTIPPPYDIKAVKAYTKAYTALADITVNYQVISIWL